MLYEIVNTKLIEVPNGAFDYALIVWCVPADSATGDGYLLENPKSGKKILNNAVATSNGRNIRIHTTLFPSSSAYEDMFIEWDEHFNPTDESGNILPQTEADKKYIAEEVPYLSLAVRDVETPEPYCMRWQTDDTSENPRYYAGDVIVDSAMNPIVKNTIQVVCTCITHEDGEETLQERPEDKAIRAYNTNLANGFFVSVETATKEAAERKAALEKVKNADEVQEIEQKVAESATNPLRTRRKF